MENIPPELLAHFIDRDDFCYPEWPAISQKVAEASLPKEYQVLLWRELVLTWLQRLLPNFGPGYKIHETESFFLVADPAGKVDRDYTAFLEQARTRLHEWLQGAAWITGDGKHVVLLFDDADVYYRYIAPYFDEGEHTSSSGFFLRSLGYCHIALCHRNPSSRKLLAYLLTLNTLYHLPLPKWLSSGLARDFSDTLFSPSDHAHISRRPVNQNFWISAQDRADHLAFWNSSTIQQFWSNRGLKIPEGTSALGIQLSRILINKIKETTRPAPAQLGAFLQSAHHNDAGAAASIDHLHVKLGDLVADFLGPGDWEPQPALWTPPNAPTSTQQ